MKGEMNREMRINIDRAGDDGTNTGSGSRGLYD